jgi:5-carboxymethyl-2-hydroxymuconate isomerase
MPHVTVEYSVNLEQHTNISALVKVVHETLVASGVLPVEAIRTRAAPREHYRIADGDPRNAFLAIVGRIAPGRPPGVREALGQTLFEAVRSHLSEIFASVPLSMTVELQEIDQSANFRHSSIKLR